MLLHKDKISIKVISLILNGIFVVTITLFILDCDTSFEIKSQIVKTLTYFGLILLSPVVLVWNLFTFKLLIKVSHLLL